MTNTTLGPEMAMRMNAATANVSSWSTVIVREGWRLRRRCGGA